MLTTEELDALDALAKTPEIAAFDGVGGVLSSLPRLLTAAREVATLRAKLIESETWRTELRAEVDAVRGRLREVTEQRDLARSALRRLVSYWQCPECDAIPPSSTWFGSRNKVFIIGRMAHMDGCAVGAALEAAR